MKTFEGLLTRLRARDRWAIASVAILGLAFLTLLSLHLDVIHTPHAERLPLLLDGRLFAASVYIVAGQAMLLWTRPSRRPPAA
jgi:hypothetical protein